MTESQCDFCTSTDVKWAFPARDFSREVVVKDPRLHAIIQAGSLGSWAACPACHALILCADRDRLARRSARRLVRKHPVLGMATALKMVRDMHDNFWSNREGAPVPIGPGDPDPFTTEAPHV